MFVHTVSALIGVSLGASLFLTSAAKADLLAGWTFEISGPSIAGSGTTFGPIAAEMGIGSAFGVHASAATVWSSPAGNGSVESFSSNTWAVGDYYEFSTTTVGYENITIEWDQTGSNTGPRDFALQYSTDGTNFTDFASYQLINGAWSAGTPVTTTSYSYDLSAITSLNNAATVYFRFTMETTVAISSANPVAAGGTGRVDNVVISGTLIPAPGALALLGLAGVMVRSRRRR